ncbi:MAG: hypothetical protein ACF8NJ_05675 [Phycisphaerales bacterium JB038]
MESKRWPSWTLCAPALLLVVLASGCATSQPNGPLTPIRWHERGVSTALVLPGRAALVNPAYAAQDPVLASRRDHDLGVRRLGTGYAGSESRLEVHLQRRESSGRVTTYDRVEETSSTVRRR